MKKILTTAAVLICAALFACSCGSKKDGKREGASGSLKSGSYGEESDDAQEERRKISDWWTSEDPASSAAQDPGNDEEGAAPDDKKDASNDDSSRRQDGEGKELPAGGGESWTKDY